MHVMVRESWTDERLDEFAKRVDERFDDLGGQMRQEFTRVDKRYEQLDKRLERLENGVASIQKAIVFGSVTMSTTFAAALLAAVLQS